MKITLVNALEAIKQTLDFINKEQGDAVSLAIVDSHGAVIAVATMDNAPSRVIKIAQAKAYTSAKMKTSTASFLKRLRDEKLELDWFCDKKFSPLPGGVPIHSDSKCLGAVGISGRSLDEDAKLAKIFADILISILSPKS